MTVHGPTPARDDADGAEAPLNLVPTCMHLRHKLMYVDVRHMSPGLVDASSTTRQYWCQLSQDARGADRLGVEPGACGSGRACFQGRPHARVALRTDASARSA